MINNVHMAKLHSVVVNALGMEHVDFVDPTRVVAGVWTAVPKTNWLVKAHSMAENESKL